MIKFYWYICRFTCQFLDFLDEISNTFQFRDKYSFLKQATSISKNYFNIFKSLISNSLIMHCFKHCLRFSLFPIMVTSSKYTKTETPPTLECLVNITWSLWLFVSQVQHHFSKSSKPCPQRLLKLTQGLPELVNLVSGHIIIKSKWDLYRTFYF